MTPERIEALLIIMTLSLMVCADLEYRIREGLLTHDETVADQKVKTTSKTTARWIFIRFTGTSTRPYNHAATGESK